METTNAIIQQKLQQLLLIDNNETATTKTDDLNFREWFLEQFKQHDNVCTLDDFAVYFLNAVRQQTEIHLRVSEGNETPKCLTPIRTLKAASVVVPTPAESANPTPKRLLPVMLEFQSTPELALSNNKLDDSFNAIGHNVSNRFGSSLDRSFSHSLQSNTSTPVRRTPNQSQQRRTGTPNSTEKTTRNNSTSNSSFCLGDFLVLNSSTNSSQRANKKKAAHQQQTHTVDTPTNACKPKKRVVPTTISNRVAGQASSPFGSGSSFSQENNILKMSFTEIDDKNKCAIKEARQSLKLNASKISKELETAAATTASPLKEKQARALLDGTNAATTCEESTNEALASPMVDLSKISDRATLLRLADIYALLIDLNFSTNVLNELSFLLNLLDANEQRRDSATAGGAIADMQALQLTSIEINQATHAQNSTSHLESLRNANNCIFFALRVLEQQRQLLALLDSKSLNVVLSSERLNYLASDLKQYLADVQQYKQQQLDAQKSLHDTSSHGINPSASKSSCKNVYYHEEQDSRQHFPTNNEFAAFKTQRDLFYKSLKLWELNHLTPTWCFNIELTPKIHEIFRQSEHTVNMAHFAKLFVAQLLISASDTQSPQDIGLEMDLQKFSKLSQRLVAPSNFSVDYQFPRKQVFFRDFISEVHSIAFTEHLKLALYAELIALNDSTFEQFPLIANEKDLDEEVQHDSSAQNEFIVRAELLASMLILAKFLGFVSAQPYSQNTVGAAVSFHANIEKQQLLLRSLFQPSYNICELLQHAIKHNKLLITLPWLVQYLVMLDNVTLQLDNLTATIGLMFKLYAQLGIETFTGSTLMPTSCFIVRCCLGWLFESKPIIAEQYYSYRSEHLTTNMVWNSVDYKREIRIMSEIPTTDSDSVVMTSDTKHISKSSTAHIDIFNTLALNPMLEAILNVACPFLAEFRVSIMPAKHAMAKYVSRTGRYRHITTRLAELPPPSSPNRTPANISDNHTLSATKKQQNKLIEAFLHSQNSSMRRLLEFVTDRTYKSVVKDAQYQILLPSKSVADAKVNDITSTQAKQVYKEVSAIYYEAREEALLQWDASMPQNLHKRIVKAMEALLPAETVPIIKQTYCQLIYTDTAHRVQQWRYANLFKNNFYCQNLNEITQKICKVNNRERQVPQSSELILVQASPSVSDLIDDLHYWLHCTSMRADLVTGADPIIAYLQSIPVAFVNTLPSVFYRLVGASIVQLLQHIINRHPHYLTQQLLAAACVVWSAPEMQQAIALPKRVNNQECNDEENDLKISASTVPSIFDGLITVPFIESLGTRHSCFDKLKELLNVLILRQLVTIDFINDLFVSIFKTDLQPSVLNEISKMLRAISHESAMNLRSHHNSDDYVLNDGKSHLFMEVLAEFSRDVDDF